MITLRKMTTAARSVPTRWVWAAVAFASGIVVGAGLMGSLMISRAPADLDAFGGGYSYVDGRQDLEGQVGISALAACQRYVDEYFYLLDGYALRSDQSFLDGCRAAAARKK